MKIIVLIISIMITFTSLYSQTFMKITQGTGATISPGNSIDEISFTTEFNCGDVVLYGGETYQTVLIGSQCWFQKNLNIGTRVNGSSEQTNNSEIEKYCYDDYDPNCTTYGGLYQWNEAMQYSITPGAQGICPEGWHIPTLEEFETLETTVGGLTNGNALLAIGVGTGSPEVGTNTSGFSLLAAGRHQNGSFEFLNVVPPIWSSTENDANTTKSRILTVDGGEICLDSPSKGSGISVRCLKD